MFTARSPHSRGCSGPGCEWWKFHIVILKDFLHRISGSTRSRLISMFSIEIVNNALEIFGGLFKVYWNFSFVMFF